LRIPAHGNHVPPGEGLTEATPIGSAMLDAIMLGTTLLFFAAALAYMAGCDRLK
jgi:hypothetical protein